LEYSGRYKFTDIFGSVLAVSDTRVNEMLNSAIKVFKQHLDSFFDIDATYVLLNQFLRRSDQGLDVINFFGRPMGSDGQSF